MRILVSCTGTLGEILPFVWFCRQLRSHGHQVFVCGPRNFFTAFKQDTEKYFVLPPDLESLPVMQADLGKALSNKGSSQDFIPRRLIDPYVDKHIEITEKVITGYGIEASFVSWVTPAVVLACRKHGVPTCCCFLSPLPLFQASDLPVFSPGLFANVKHQGPEKGLDIRRGIHEYYAALTPRLNQAALDIGYDQEELGLFPLRRSRGPCLAFFPECLLRQPEDGVMHLANKWCVRRSILPEVISEFLSQGPPPVVVSFGTIVLDHKQQINDEAISACKDCGHRVICVKGVAGSSISRPANDLLLVDNIALSVLAPWASCIIHHGGIGSTQESLAAGVPSLILPQIFDQFDNAKRVEWLDVGRSLSPLEQDARRISERLADLLASSAISSNAVALKKSGQLVDGISVSEAITECFEH